MDGNEGAPTAEKFERTFFVIDITKLKREDDQLVNAKLMFRPEEKYLKVWNLSEAPPPILIPCSLPKHTYTLSTPIVPLLAQYEQLCSQLVGLSVCSMNLTGRYPQYLKLRNSGYAIKALGEDCIMVSLVARSVSPVWGAWRELLYNFK